MVRQTADYWSRGGLKPLPEPLSCPSQRYQKQSEPVLHYLVGTATLGGILQHRTFVLASGPPAE